MGTAEHEMPNSKVAWVNVIASRCEAFMTTENCLPKNAAHIERELGIRVVTPARYWELLRPWAKLYV